MNFNQDPYLAQGFSAVMGRPPTAQDWADLREQEEIRRTGGAPKPSIWDQVTPIAGAAGSLAGLYLGKEIMANGLGSTASSIGSGLGSLFGGGSAAAPAVSTTAASAGVTVPGSVGLEASSGGGWGLEGLGGSLGTAATLAGGALGAYGLYDTLANAPEYKLTGKDLGMQAGKGLASGAALGTAIMPGIGTIIGGGLGGLLGLGSGLWGSGKDKYQVSRDNIRDFWEERGLLGDDHTLNGWEIGKDGGFRLADGRKNYEIYAGQDKGKDWDWTPEASEAVGLLNPIGILTTQADRDLGGMGTGMLYNALQETGDPGVTTDEVKGLYDRLGWDQQTAFEGINELYQSGKISENEARAYQGGINTAFGKEYYTPKDFDRRSVLARIWG